MEGSPSFIFIDFDAQFAIVEYVVSPVLVVQRIERKPPKLQIQVRFLSRTHVYTVESLQFIIIGYTF